MIGKECNFCTCIALFICWEGHAKSRTLFILVKKKNVGRKRKGFEEENLNDFLNWVSFEVLRNSFA